MVGIIRELLLAECTLFLNPLGMVHNVRQHSGHIRVELRTRFWSGVFILNLTIIGSSSAQRRSQFLLNQISRGLVCRGRRLGGRWKLFSSVLGTAPLGRVGRH